MTNVSIKQNQVYTMSNKNQEVLTLYVSSSEDGQLLTVVASETGPDGFWHESIEIEKSLALYYGLECALYNLEHFEFSILVSQFARPVA